MAITYDTKNIIKELVSILNASRDLEKVASSAVVPLGQETEEVAVYVNVPNITAELESTGNRSDAYNRHMTVSIHCNVDCKDDEFRIYDIIDSIERSILSDNTFWSSIIDRDIITIEYDAQEHFPKRAAVIIMRILFKLACD